MPTPILLFVNEWNLSDFGRSVRHHTIQIT